MMLVAAITVGAQQHPFDPGPLPPPMLPGTGDPCATGETPCNPDQPWMRGTIEKSCAHEELVQRLRDAVPGRIVLTCACKHMCNEEDDHASMTDRRTWDARCEARCNPSNCQCPHPCDS